MKATKLFTAFNAIVMFAIPAAWAKPSVQSTANVYWFWDADHPVGTAQLVRTPSGITAILHSSELPADQAVTLWFIIFNNPEHCLANPCSVPFDVFTPGVDADFHFASGQVTGGSGNATFAAHLSPGDTSGSGRVELGIDGGFALADPYKAEVLLALHSHGPKLKGQDLKRQISSFAGGCDVFVGPDGFAGGPQDVPDARNECSTIQYSLHQASSGD